MGWNIAGPEKNIKGMTRKHFTDYMSEQYKAGNMVLVVAGNVSVKDAVDLGERYFSRVAKGKVKKAEKVSLAQKKPAVAVRYKKTDQAHLVVGFKVPVLKDKDRYALVVMNAILGGGMSSRLFIEVRERRGLAYYVRSDMDRHMDCGVFGVAVGSDIRRVEETIEVIMAELSKMSSEKVTQTELEKVKDMIEGRIALSREAVLSDAEAFASDLIIDGEIREVEDILAQIRAINADDILRLTKKIFMENNLNLAVIGPYRSESKFERLLKI